MVSSPMNRKWISRLLGVVSLAVLGGILVLGLWPFSPYPHNDVNWIPNGDGLEFTNYGVVLSAGNVELKPASPGKLASQSVELWLQPGLTDDTNTMLGFYTPKNPLQFRVCQEGDSLFVLRDYVDEQGKVRGVQMEVDHVFHQDQKLLITVTSGPRGAAIYLNGALAGTSTSLGLTNADFTGQLVFGTSAVDNDSWTGQLYGIAVYDRELMPSEVTDHYIAWDRDGRLRLAEAEGATALYLFEERAGSVVHNQVRSGPDLYIPEHYFLLDKAFLEPFWKEFSPTWGYCKDILINIGGFVPLGFSFCAYLSYGRRMNRAVLATVLLGGIVSFVIEFSQGFFPTRASGTTDLITNTLGTALGAAIARSKVAQSLFAEV